MKSKNKEKMYQLVERLFAGRGLKEDFCRAYGINLHKLNYWIKRYNKEHGIRRQSRADNALGTSKDKIYGLYGQVLYYLYAPVTDL